MTTYDVTYWASTNSTMTTTMEADNFSIDEGEVLTLYSQGEDGVSRRRIAAFQSFIKIEEVQQDGQGAEQASENA